MTTSLCPRAQLNAHSKTNSKSFQIKKTGLAAFPKVPRAIQMVSIISCLWIFSFLKILCFIWCHAKLTVPTYLLGGKINIMCGWQSEVIWPEQQVSHFLLHTRHVTIWSKKDCQASCPRLDTHIFSLTMKIFDQAH